MISFWRWEAKRPAEWDPLGPAPLTLALFKGTSDWRLGAAWETHPHEWQVTISVPCLQLVIERLR